MSANCISSRSTYCAIDNELEPGRSLLKVDLCFSGVANCVSDLVFLGARACCGLSGHGNGNSLSVFSLELIVLFVKLHVAHFFCLFLGSRLVVHEFFDITRELVRVHLVVFFLFLISTVAKRIVVCLDGGWRYDLHKQSALQIDSGDWRDFTFLPSPSTRPTPRKLADFFLGGMLLSACIASRGW
jgi:hypothetical protein